MAQDIEPKSLLRVLFPKSDSQRCCWCGADDEKLYEAVQGWYCLRCYNQKRKIVAQLLELKRKWFQKILESRSCLNMSDVTITYSDKEDELYIKFNRECITKTINKEQFKEEVSKI